LKIKGLTLRFRDKKWFDRSGSVAKRINNKIVEEEFSRNPYIEINFNRLFEGINVRGKSILIIGVNRGYETELFLKRGAKAVTGIDVFLPKQIYKKKKISVCSICCRKTPVR
jgi:hypothetical protein